MNTLQHSDKNTQNKGKQRLSAGQKIICRLLGATDETWLIKRWQSGDDHHRILAKTKEEQCIYRKKGLRWRPKLYAPELDEKTADRTLRDLENQNIIQTYSANERLTHVKLTRQGITLARAAATTLEEYDVHKYLHTIFKHEEDPGPARREGYVSEDIIVDHAMEEGGDEVLENYILHVTMALAREHPARTQQGYFDTAIGLVECNQDGDGRAYYRTTREGARYLDGAFSILEDTKEKPSYSKKRDDLYDKAMTQRRRELTTEPPENTSELYIIPLPVAMP